jgi:cbb3-type cytochrome oxidase maturation protein
MSVIFIVVPVALVLVGAAVAAFVWAARRGQFDDVTTPAIRAVVDDADEPAPPGGRAARTEGDAHED